MNGLLRSGLAAALALCSTTALAASNDQWRSRSIYQVLTDRFARTDGSTDATCDTSVGKYCGGTFKGISNHLDYIQGMGFDAIWISPVTAQLQGSTPYGEPYHGYWQQDIFSINSHFGSSQDLKDLASDLHGRGMYLMVDIVVNHFAYNGAPSNVDYSQFSPFDSASDFHTYCPIDYDDIYNDQLERCWVGDTTVSLPDVKTEDDNVARQWNDWIKNLVAEYGIDGLRIDTAIEVDTGFWKGFGNAAGVYYVGETYNGVVDFVCGLQDYMPGIMDYPTYYTVLDAFTNTPASDGGLMDSLANRINEVKSSCKDTSLKGTFTENHDRPRIAQVNGDMSAARNVIAYTILADGIPIIYEGQEQHYDSRGGSGDPYNREAIWFSGYNRNAELYQLVKKLNAARKAAISDDCCYVGDYLGYQNYPIYTDTTTIAMRKGKMVTVLSNKGQNGDAYTQSIPAGYDAGTQVTEVVTCQTLTADGNGAINVPMSGGQPRVYYPSAGLQGKGVC